MKKIILVAVVALFGFTMNAQEFKAGINGALPIGDAGDVADFSIGLDLAYLWNVGESFDVGVASGFTTAFTKDITVLGNKVSVDDVQFLPIAGAARYNVSEDFFFGADLGYAVGINDGNDGGLYYRPKIGYNLTEKFSLNLSYTGIARDGNTWDTIGLGVEYGF
ncbi:hypothetical protein [uncultured Kordia sp.]|uniref:hypothetical protein n=1 Tax=uncultured Kordia sp. TaxID=507699 RepID=UPI002613DACF|nr:hypothetical protein [uncultured Kordia sp.]